MHLWALRRLPIGQATQMCFCQQTSLFAQHTTVSLLYNKTLIPKLYFTSSSPLCKILVAQTLSVPRTRYVGLTTTMTEEGYSSSAEKQQTPEAEPPKLSKKERLKKAVKDYGATVIIFHITISLMSLGISYLVISSGVDVGSLLDKVGVSSTSDIATGASTFVVAYAVHKIFAPSVSASPLAQLHLSYDI